MSRCCFSASLIFPVLLVFATLLFILFQRLIWPRCSNQLSPTPSPLRFIIITTTTSSRVNTAGWCGSRSFLRWFFYFLIFTFLCLDLTTYLGLFQASFFFTKSMFVTVTLISHQLWCHLPFGMSIMLRHLFFS